MVESYNYHHCHELLDIERLTQQRMTIDENRRNCSREIIRDHFMIIRYFDSILSVYVLMTYHKSTINRNYLIGLRVIEGNRHDLNQVYRQ